MDEKYKKEEEKYVRWIVFIWIIGIITTILFSSIGISMKAKSEVSELRGELKVYSTDILWIKNTLIEIKESIKN